VTSATAAASRSKRRTTGRHRGRIVLPVPPDDREKVAYLSRHKAYLSLVIGIGGASVIASQAALEMKYGLWLLAPYTGYVAIYMAIAVTVHSTGSDFDYARHRDLVDGWRPARFPDVDIFLPICGEPLEVLRNTWACVAELVSAYPGWAQPYVLDDGADPEAGFLAETFGFTYVLRPDRGRMRKAGNLRYAFAHTAGELIVIFDADFTPRPDFLAETLPYFADLKLGILQTPQFFRTSRRQNWVERAGNAVQEVFYRNIQPARDHFGAAVCCGTCAVYRRRALEADGGFAEVAYAEDEHTGLNVRAHGYRVKYIPVSVAAGMSPPTVDNFVRQQYRWCSGTYSTLRRWPRLPFRGRLMYASGLLYYLYSASMVFIGPVVPVVLLIFLSGRIQPHDYLLLGPAVINGIVFYPVWHRCDFGPSTWPLAIISGWSHVLALWDFIWRRTMQWQPTGGSRTPVRRLWVALIGWNATTAAAWLGVAGWRIWQAGPARFWLITAFGTTYAGVVLRVLVKGDRA
jgi:cellulose synthase (UDP-forming)